MLQTLLPLVEKLLDKCENSKALLHEDESILLQLILQKCTPDTAALLQEESKCWKEMLRVLYLRSAVCPGHPAPMLTMIGQVSALKWVFATCLEAVYKKCFVASNPSEALIAGTVIFFPSKQLRNRRFRTLPCNFEYFRPIFNVSRLVSNTFHISFHIPFQKLPSGIGRFLLVSDIFACFRTVPFDLGRFHSIFGDLSDFGHIRPFLDTPVRFR